MKIHRVVTMLGATTSTGKLASDMYELGKKYYYSEDRGYKMPISEMDFQHMVRAFVKLSEQEDMLDRSKHFSRTVEVVKNKDKTIKKLQDDLKDGFKQSVDDLEQLTYQEKIINGLRSETKGLKEKVERLEGIIEEKDEQIDKLHEEKKPKGYEYMFSEIPNTEYGEKLVKSMRAYLNDETYTMRVRGQHLKKELYGQGRAYWGQSIEDSSHLRVYINKKHIKWKDIK